MDNKKKVGIITSYLDFDKNYGGVLQAYALSRQINLLGFEAYIMPYIYEFYPPDTRAKKRFWRFLRYCKAHFHPKYRKHLNQTKMNHVMMEWVENKLPLFRKERMMLADLSSVSDDFYAFVCGSDQVWSTRLQRDHCDPGMFLQFVPQNIRKIAYAPSMGSTTSVSNETALEIMNAVSGFYAISVREEAGRKLLNQILDKDIPLVLDPTLLLPQNEWESIVEIPSDLPEKYILLYRFGNLQSNMEKIREIQEYLGYPIIELPSSRISIEDDFEKRFDITPGMFLGIVRNAALVCTDSFHATVFSILNETPFITFYRQEPSTQYNMNSRIEELLAMTGLSNRLITPGQKICYEELWKLDFEYAHEKIATIRKSSLDYLSGALKEVNI